MIYNKRWRNALILMLVGFVFFLLTSTAFAGVSTSGDADSMFASVVKFLATWIGRIGLVVGFIGAVQAAFGIRNDDPDSKIKGIRTAASGFIVFAITLSLNLFGIT